MLREISEKLWLVIGLLFQLVLAAVLVGAFLLLLFGGLAARRRRA